MTWLIVSAAAWLAVSVAVGVLIGRSAARDERLADRDIAGLPSDWGGVRTAGRVRSAE